MGMSDAGDLIPGIDDARRVTPIEPYSPNVDRDTEDVHLVFVILRGLDPSRRQQRAESLARHVVMGFGKNGAVYTSEGDLVSYEGVSKDWPENIVQTLQMFGVKGTS